MSLDLVDVRLKVPLHVNCYLEAVAKVTMREKGAVAREMLCRGVSERMRAAKIAEKLMQVEGLSGSLGEDQA